MAKKERPPQIHRFIPERGPVYTPMSRWMTSDGVNYHTSSDQTNDGPAGHKQWSDRGFPDNYADNPRQAQGYRKSPPWRGSDFIQNLQRHFFTNPHPQTNPQIWPRFNENSTNDVDAVPCEIQVGMAGIVQHQFEKKLRAPDARWADVVEAEQPLPAQNLSNAAGEPYAATSVGRNWRLAG